MPSTMRAAGTHPHPQIGLSVDLRDMSRIGSDTLVRAAVDASRTSDRGTRAPHIRDLESELMKGRSVTLPRVLHLLMSARKIGKRDAVVSFVTQLEGLLDLVDGTPVIPLRDALRSETAAQCESDPIQMEFAMGDDSTPNLVRLIQGLRQHRDALDRTLASAEAELFRRQTAVA